MTASDVLDGNQTIHVSHAGGEFMSMLLEEARTESIRKWVFFFQCLFPLSQPSRPKYNDARTRHDRVENRNEGFKHQLTPMVDAYLSWQLEVGNFGFDNAVPPDPSPAASTGTPGLQVQVMDMFHESAARSYTLNIIDMIWF